MLSMGEGAVLCGHASRRSLGYFSGIVSAAVQNTRNAGSHSFLSADATAKRTMAVIQPAIGPCVKNEDAFRGTSARALADAHNTPSPTTAITPEFVSSSASSIAPVAPDENEAIETRIAPGSPLYVVRNALISVAPSRLSRSTLNAVAPHIKRTVITIRATPTHSAIIFSNTAAPSK